MLPLSLFVALLGPALVLASSRPAKRYYNTHDYYVLEHNSITGATIAECAEALGIEVVEQVGELVDHWLVRKAKPDMSRRRYGSDRVLDTLGMIRSRANQQTWARSTDVRHARRISSAVRSLSKQQLRKRVKRADPPITQGDVPAPGSAAAVAESLGIKDPNFKDQWHFVNEEFSTHTLNVTGLWKEGVTGKGVISAIVDDGLDFQSDDLADNFDAEGSYDFNDHVPLPKPTLWDDHHGTRCAGEVAAIKNNVCGVGVAYESKVAGIRILSGSISDADEAAALNLGYQKTALYSCSWGPPDDGRSMEGPSILIQKAVLNGINKGRGGKGSVFVFASGNGAGSGDQCNFDGYTNSIYSITVAAIDYKGAHPYYSEACAANMVVTYSSGAGKHITSTDVGKNKCSNSHGGTSAAAPLAVGVFALALSVRPDLTWRDMQHLCVRTAVQVNPEDPDWQKTAIGRPYSYKYGYGKLDAYAYVNAARTWEVVKPQAWFEMPTVKLADAMIKDDKMSGGEIIVAGGITSRMMVTRKISEINNFEKLEHITVKVWITHAKRGDVEVELVSPAGVKSILAGARKHDDDSTGFNGWQFMTLKHWDEEHLGEWSLRVSDQNDAAKNGSFLGWSMTLWGSTKEPGKAKLYELPDETASVSTSTTAPTSTDSTDSTKVYVKPTQFLSSGHGDVHGETTSAAFQKPTDAIDAAVSPTPDEGYFMPSLLKSQTWLFAALGAVFLFAIGAGVFFWRRSVKRRMARGDYMTVAAGDDLPMSSLDQQSRGGLLRGDTPRTKELYDAFGELSDDEDADESAALNRRLDDDDVPYHDAHDGTYRDDDGADHVPVAPYLEGTSHHVGGRDTPGSGSGGESWEHASDAARQS